MKSDINVSNLHFLGGTSGVGVNAIDTIIANFTYNDKNYSIPIPVTYHSEGLTKEVIDYVLENYNKIIKNKNEKI